MEKIKLNWTASNVFLFKTTAEINVTAENRKCLSFLV